MKALAAKPVSRRPVRPPVRPPARRERPRMPADLPPVVQRRLHALAARTLHVGWANGLFRLLAAAGILIVVQCATDLLLDLPTRTRALFLLGDLAIVGFLGFRHGVQPWQRRPSPDDAALLAQRRWPEFRSTLISAVQLARQPNGSPWMVAALQREVAERVARTDLRQAVPWRGVRTPFLVALGVLAVTAGLTWWTAPTSGILLRRAGLAKLPLPTRTIVVAISENLSIPPGDTIELSARARGEVPRSGRVEIRYAGKPVETVSVTPRASRLDVFSFSLPNVQQPFTYRFYLNDGRGPEWPVTLLHPPTFQSVAFRAVYPPYAGLPEAPVAAGNLRLLAGSRLQITGRSSQPLQSARVVPQGEVPPVELHPGADRSEWKGELPIPPRGLTGFSVNLKDEQNVASRNDTLYAVEIVPDRPPEILVPPDQAEKATLISTARPGLRFEVRDDFLVQKVFLCVQPADTLAEGESPDPAKARRVPIPFKQPAGTLSFDFRWEAPEQTVKWQEGNTFYYWIEAVDNNDVTGPGVTRTPVREWSVVSLKTKRDELTETLRRSADSIENLSRSQEELRSQVGNLLKQNDGK